MREVAFCVMKGRTRDKYVKCSHVLGKERLIRIKSFKSKFVKEGRQGGREEEKEKENVLCSQEGWSLTLALGVATFFFSCFNFLICNMGTRLHMIRKEECMVVLKIK